MKNGNGTKKASNGRGEGSSHSHGPKVRIVGLRPLEIIATTLAFHALEVAKEKNPNATVLGDLTAAELLAISTIQLRELICPACGCEGWANRANGCDLCAIGSIVDSLYTFEDEDAEASHL